MSKTKATLLGVGTTYATHAGTSAIQSIAKPRYGSGGSYVADYLPPALVAGAGAYYLTKDDKQMAYALIGAAAGDVALRLLASKFRFDTGVFAKGVQAISNSVAYGINDTSIGYCAMFPFEAPTLTAETVEQMLKICTQNSKYAAWRIISGAILSNQVWFDLVLDPEPKDEAAPTENNVVIEVYKPTTDIVFSAKTESEYLEMISQATLENHEIMGTAFKPVFNTIKALIVLNVLIDVFNHGNTPLAVETLSRVVGKKDGSDITRTGFKLRLPLKATNATEAYKAYSAPTEALMVELGLARPSVLAAAVKAKEAELKEASKTTQATATAQVAQSEPVASAAARALAEKYASLNINTGAKTIKTVSPFGGGRRQLGKIIAEPNAKINLRSSDEDFKPNLPAVSEMETRGALIGALNDARPLSQSELLAEDCGSLGVGVVVVRVSASVCEQAVSLGLVVDLGPSKLQRGLRLVSVEGGAGVYTPSQAKEYGVSEGLLDTSAIEPASTIDVVSEGILTRSTFRPLYR